LANQLVESLLTLSALFLKLMVFSQVSFRNQALEGFWQRPSNRLKTVTNSLKLLAVPMQVM
jgi:hypothetical protein